MKTYQHLIGMAFIAIFAIAITTCNNGDNNPPETFTVTFNADGGNPTPQTQTVEKGKTATEPTGDQAPTKANNTLDGWYKEGNLTKWNFATAVTENITLKAKWLCNCPNGTLHLVGEDCCTGTPCNCEVVAGQRVNGVAITNRDNLVSETDFETIVTRFTTAFNNASISDTQRTFIAANLEEVRVITGQGTESPVVSNNVLVLETGHSAGTIRTALLNWCTANSITM